MHLADFLFPFHDTLTFARISESMEGQVSEAISGVAVETLTGEHAFVQGILPRVRSIERRLSGVFDDEDNENAADVDCSSVSA